MKKLFLKTRLFTVTAACLLSAYTITGCKDDDVDSTATEVRYNNVALNGLQEFPPVITTRTGSFSGTFNKTTKVLTYNITHNVADATAAHFHEAPKDSSGAVVIPIAAGTAAAPIPSPINSTATLTPVQESDLLRGRLYVNIHSPAHPSGEIRGQVPAE